MSRAPTAPRVRFAPSPTGYFHVGGARAALYNWLFCRHFGGSFVLRIEDTDRERSKEEWVAGICEALLWLDITWDEGPYRQSERLPLYEAAAERLYRSGYLYACDCTREQIEERAKAHGGLPGYDGFCRDRGLEKGPGRALRFRVPDDGETVVHDLVRGDVVFSHEAIEDFVVVKSNGDPLFVLAVVVDDIDMAISHIIRGEEHLPTTPKAILLWQALAGGPLPVFAHLPVLVNERRRKLSKRRDRVAVEDYRDAGYLAEAMVNYLALLGWGPGGDREVLTREELIDEFRLEDVLKSPAFFDERKLTHFNGLYIRALPTGEFSARAAPFLERGSWPPERFDRAVWERLAPLVQERVATLAEVSPMVAFVFDEPFVPDEEAFEKTIRGSETATVLLAGALDAFATCPWNAAALHQVVSDLGESVGLKLGKAQAPIRVATMGRTVGLPLFESLEVLGRTITIERIEAALARQGDA